MTAHFSNVLYVFSLFFWNVEMDLIWIFKASTKCNNMNVRRYLFDMRHIDVILFSSWKINLRANQFLQRFFPILLLPSFYKYLIIIKQPPYFIVFLLKIRQYFFMINHRASCVWPNCALSNVLYVFSLFFWAFIFYFHYSNVSITMATRVHTASFWNIIFSWLPMMIWQKN